MPKLDAPQALKAFGSKAAEMASQDAMGQVTGPARGLLSPIH